MRENLVRNILYAIAAIGLVAILIMQIWRGPGSIYDEEPDFRKTASELYEEFENNEKAALKKYTDKIILVEGRVSKSVETGEGATLILSSGGMGGVNCSMGEWPRGNLAIEGDLVRIKGRCTGFLMDVLLKDCRMIED